MQPTATAALLASYERFIRLVPAMRSLGQLAEETLRAVEATGLDTLQAGTFPSVGEADRAQFHFGNWPSAWMELYTTSGLMQHDPLPEEVRLRMQPFTWTEFRARQPLLPEARAVLDTANAWGWTEGFVIPVHGPGSFIGIVSFCGHEVQPLDPFTRAVVTSVGHAAFARGTELHAGAAQDGVPPLTAAEQRVMRLVAAGSTDPEVARTLGISPNTARFHVDAVKRKLRVRTRSEATGIVVRLGLI
jgi:LuxR family quorum sensing-dependent transcriptional regulator